MKISGKITAEYVSTIVEERKRELHKGDFGKLLVIAGSKGMAGAAVLCGKAALKAGAGLVTVSISEDLFPILQTALPEAMCIGREAAAGNFAAYDAIAIGPGLSVSAENEKLIELILSGYGGTVVLDADGLNTLALAGKVGLINKARAKVIITPHAGEAKRLIPAEKSEKEWPENDVHSEQSRLKITEMLLIETGTIVVLKGAGSIVASAEEGAYINTTGNPGMATGGSGDALTGIIAALAGQKKSPWDSAKAGVFLHGLAGDMAARDMGEYGMTAMDIVNMTALAFKEFAGVRR